MTAGMWCIGASLLFFALAQNLASALIGYFFLGVTFQVGVLYLTKAQESTEVNYQGRVYSTFNTFFALTSFLIYLSMGFLGAIISLRWLYGSQVLLLGIAGVIAYIWIYRKEKIQVHHAEQIEVEEKEAAQPKAGG
jgi:MFS family permease